MFQKFVISLSPDDIFLLQQAIQALVDETAMRVATFSSTEGIMYKVARDKYDRACEFQARFRSMMEEISSDGS